LFDGIGSIYGVEYEEETYECNIREYVIVLALGLLGKEEQYVETCRIYCAKTVQEKKCNLFAPF
jgi:hypothetical protein